MKTLNTVLIIVITALDIGVAAAASHHAPSEARVGHSAAVARGQKHGKKGRRSEVFLVRDYYAQRGLPPGLARRGTLPPGLRRQLVVGGHLPPGLEKRLYPVPVDLVAVLPRLPRHQRRFFLGVDLLVVDTRRDVVVSIVADVLH